MTDRTDDPFADAAKARQEKMNKHAELRASPEFVAALQHTHQLAADFQIAVASIGLMSMRWHGFRERSLTLRIQDHLLQSLIAIVSLIDNGFHGPARREMRFIVEASVKAWAADLADMDGKVADKIEDLDDLGWQRFGAIVDGLSPKLLSGDALTAFPARVKSLYKKLCTHVHMSASQIKHDFEGFERGEHFGYETAQQVTEINALFQDVLDLALLVQFEAFDRGLVGDIFVHLLDAQKKWIFHETLFVANVSRFFDYKAERKVTHGP